MILSTMALTAADYTLWIQQPVYGKGPNKQSRYSILKVFSEDLVESMRRLGYPMGSAYKGAHTVGNWLYQLHCRAYRSNRIQLKLPKPIHRDWEEDQEHFLSMVTWEWVQEFASYWKEVDTFDSDTMAGKETWESFPLFLYIYSNIDGSSHAKYVEDLVYAEELEESSSDSKKKDVFLVEMEKGYHGDGWGR